MSHYNRFEKEVLKTMKTLPEYANDQLKDKKKLIRGVWDHLNKHVHIKGSGFEKSKGRGQQSGSPPSGSKSNIDSNVKTMMDTVSLLKSAMGAAAIGSAIIPYLL